MGRHFTLQHVWKLVSPLPAGPVHSLLAGWHGGTVSASKPQLPEAEFVPGIGCCLLVHSAHDLMGFPSTLVSSHFSKTFLED